MGCGCDSGEKQSSIRVEGMKGEMAAEKLREALIKVDGVEDAFVDYVSGACIINHFCGEGIEEKIESAIRTAGFNPVTSLKTY